MANEGQTPVSGDQNQPSPAPGSDSQGGQPNPQNTPNPPARQPEGQTPQAPNPRDAGILRDLQNERRARQAAEARIAAAEAAVEAERRRVQALAGVTPRSQDDTDADEVRQRFTQLFPGLAKLNNEQMLAKLEQLLESADTHAETTKRYWADRAQQMTQGVVDAVAKELGGTLSERQIGAIRRAYAATAEADPDFLARHEQGDPTLIKEFAAAWVEDWVGPAKRAAITNEVGRMRPVPGSRDRSISQPGGKKAIDFKDPKAVEDAMVESFRSNGGRFTNE